MALGLNDQTKIGLVNRFEVVVTGNYNLGNWSKVTGLQVSWDLAELRTGDQGNQRYLYPGNTKYNDIVLERAACPDSITVRDWLGRQSFDWKGPQPGAIILKDSNNDEIVRWDIRGIIVKTWQITPFDAAQSAVAKETLTFSHQGFLTDLISAQG